EPCATTTLIIIGCLACRRSKRRPRPLRARVMKLQQPLVIASLGLIALIAAASQLASAAPIASFTPLGDLPGGTFQSGAFGVSSAGWTVVGSSSSAITTEPIRWSASGGMQRLGLLPNAAATLGSDAIGANRDGSVIVGYSGYELSTGEFRYEAFRWTAAGGM